MRCTSANILVSMEIQSDSPLWQQLRTQTNPSYLLGTRLKSELVEHLYSWNTGTVKRSACTFTLHTIFTLHRTRQLMRTRGQPHGWLVQPQMELDWPLGSFCSHLWSFKITNAFFKKLLLTEENRTQNSCKEWDKASKSVFDLKTTGDFLGNYSSKLPVMGRQGEQKSNGLPTGKGVR